MPNHETNSLRSTDWRAEQVYGVRSADQSHLSPSPDFGECESFAVSGALIGVSVLARHFICAKRNYKTLNLQ